MINNNLRIGYWRQPRPNELTGVMQEHVAISIEQIDIYNFSSIRMTAGWVFYLVPGDAPAGPICLASKHVSVMNRIASRPFVRRMQRPWQSGGPTGNGGIRYLTPPCRKHTTGRELSVVNRPPATITESQLSRNIERMKYGEIEVIVLNSLLSGRIV